jgi:MoaE-MoaD fusion protein
MHVRVLFFGVLKDLAGRSAEMVELPPGSCLADLLAYYGKNVARLGDYESSLALSVNREYAARDTLLHDDDEVALLPPVSGGADAAQPGTTGKRALLVRERIDAERLVESMKQSADGAVVIFDGIVRDNSRGRRTLYLEYESYEPMALEQLELLVTQAVKDFAIRDALVVHRLGRIEIGATSVLIVVASAHRAAAFDACRWMIDTLKKTVPIWKREYFEDGAVWADGEPFPPEISKPASKSKEMSS